MMAQKIPEVKYEGRTTLVTGGAGFIGSELTRQLVDHGAHVVVADNLVTGKWENLKGLPDDRVQRIEADILDDAALGACLAGVDVVFHLACLSARHSLHDPVANHEVNASGTLRILTAALKSKVKQFVHVSTSHVYGDAVRIPMDESHPLFPTTVYGASKLAGEAYARAFHRTYGLPTVIIRPFNTYGVRGHHEGTNGEVIPLFILRCLIGRPLIVLGDGGQRLDFTDVRDIAKGILAAGSNEKLAGETINLGSGSDISINELAYLIADVTGSSGVILRHEAPRSGDSRRLCSDCTKARSLLGFEPAVSLREGLEHLVEWYKSLDRKPEDLLSEGAFWDVKNARPHGD